MNLKHRVLLISLATLGYVASTLQAQAQERTQDDIALHVIASAIGGGIFGVAGTLTRLAVEDAMKRPSNDVSMQAGVSTSATYAYSAPGEGRSGVRYNMPCTNFDPGTGRLLSCGGSTDSAILPSRGTSAVSATRAHSFASGVHVRKVRTADYRSQRIHVRTAHASRGGHR